MHWKTHFILNQELPSDRLMELREHLLRSLDLTSKEAAEAFFDPPHPLSIDPTDAGIDPKELAASTQRILDAIKDQEPILVFGDYDADGITATALLWETLFSLGAKASPFIPHRQKHGYGLSEPAIRDAFEEIGGKPKIVITVDNGIVAHEAAEYLRQENVELILTDHHQKGSTLPYHNHLVHSTQISGSAVAWFLVKELSQKAAEASLDLVTIGTVADMMPLVGTNRSIVKHGLLALKNTQRKGLQALYQEAGIDEAEEFSTYHINFVIAPRINAMGRLENAMDSLRLLCTRNTERARSLAVLLTATNQSRQDLTQQFITLAEDNLVNDGEHILIVSHPEFHEGIIGLVAGKLTERYSKPSIVLSMEGTTAKASARSVKGVNIIQLIRQFEHHLINAGGHPLAAGFSIETDKVASFTQDVQLYAKENITSDLLEPHLDIDCEISLADIDFELLDLILTFKPFGLGNSQPMFSVQGARVADYKLVGRDQRHLKIVLQDDTGKKIHAIGFGLADKEALLNDNPKISLAFHVVENNWNGKRFLQLQVKDILV